jgi:hypothetical protein
MSVDNTAARVSYGAEEAAMQAYLRDGERRAFELGNRGPIRFTSDGALHPDILEAYGRCGFYVFEGVLKPEELADIEADVSDILGRLPTEKGASVDAKGRPALDADCNSMTLLWSKPLGDPFGGTALMSGRHPIKMIEPDPAAGAPKEVVYLITGSLRFSEAALRIYGHPQLLAVAAAINGEDFVPFNESLFLKAPGLGASIAWHQDGVTHWGDGWDENVHGFNFGAQLYGCTPANGVWVVPGSHRRGKVDIAGMVAKAGSERLPDAVPTVCKPGDVAMTNRQALHGSFANTSRDWRVTVNFGFHRRSSVLGVKVVRANGAQDIYDAGRIRLRARAIGYAIDARHRRFPDEIPYSYKPHLGDGEACRWDAAARTALKDYNLLDLAI